MAEPKLIGDILADNFTTMLQIHRSRVNHYESEDYQTHVKNKIRKRRAKEKRARQQRRKNRKS